MALPAKCDEWKPGNQSVRLRFRQQRTLIHASTTFSSILHGTACISTQTQEIAQLCQEPSKI